MMKILTEKCSKNTPHCSGFFWLLSLLVASIFWFAISHLTSHLAPSLIIAVVTQEAMRFAFYKLIVKADEGLHLITANMRATPPTLQVADSRRLSPASGGGDRNSFEFAIPVNRRSSDLLRPVQGGLGGILSHQIVAYVAGLGFGVMSCVVELLRLLHESYGPGIHFDNLESKFFFVVAVLLYFIDNYFLLSHSESVPSYVSLNDANILVPCAVRCVRNACLCPADFRLRRASCDLMPVPTEYIPVPLA
ncbi:unnamed protein product [Calicophoron daubneyi]|uniref:Uncharacterized protein n=1 Tax=Calicophoron daubneyi TaxID=300641 RepID=A0AAV2TPT2_CALDB